MSPASRSGFRLRSAIVAVLQVGLGAIFLWASYHKIAEPPDFAHQIYNYKITPGALINLIAIYLPWIEAVAGVALMTGVLARGASTLAAAMLVVFIAALGFNLWRGHPVDCGCFASSAASGADEKSSAELLADMRWRIVEDAGMLLAAIAILWIGPVTLPWLDRRRRGESGSEGAAPAVSPPSAAPERD